MGSGAKLVVIHASEEGNRLRTLGRRRQLCEM